MKAGDILGGKYRLTSQIGEGAMGVVWSATNELTRREVALKLILRSSDDLRHRMMREARACGTLSHRNIIEVFDVGLTDSGDPFLVMPLLTGETLAELLERQRRLEPGVAAQLARDIARALEAAHAASIIHRDLKPANIFLHKEAGSDGPIVKVLDFGVSKNLAAQDTVATVVGGLVGSPAYMSPEQVLMVRDLDHRTDLWTLGIILYQMLTGVRPFQGDAQDVIQKIVAGPIPLVSDRVRTVDRGIVEIVSRCLERDRSKRFQSASELVAALSALAQPSDRSSIVDGLSRASSSDHAHLGVVQANPASASFAPAPVVPRGLEPVTYAGELVADDDDDEESIATQPIKPAFLLGMVNRAPSNRAVPAPEVVPPREAFVVRDSSAPRSNVASAAAPPPLQGGDTQLLAPSLGLTPFEAPSPRSSARTPEPVTTPSSAPGALNEAYAPIGPKGTILMNKPRMLRASSGTSSTAALVQSASDDSSSSPEAARGLPGAPPRKRSTLVLGIAGGTLTTVLGLLIAFSGLFASKDSPPSSPTAPESAAQPTAPASSPTAETSSAQPTGAPTGLVTTPTPPSASSQASANAAEIPAPTATLVSSPKIPPTAPPSSIPTTARPMVTSTTKTTKTSPSKPASTSGLPPWLR